MSVAIPPMGWIPFDRRTDEQNATHNKIVATMPAFDLPPQGKPEPGTKILLTDSWKHSKVVEALGFEFPGWHQFTGSCVGVGGGNASQTTSFMDVLQRGDMEKIVLIFWLYNYGRSRQLGGMRGRGEGSFGSTFAESLKTDGAMDWVKTLGLPSYQDSDQLVVGANVEMEWSDGNHASQGVRDEARPHRIISAPVSSGADVRDGIINGYAFTRAFSKFVNPGTAHVKNGCLVGSYNGRGGHQESWLGYWNHPQNGELIFEMNQWGKEIYGVDPGGGPKGGVWIPIEEVDRECQNGEVYALSQYDGYPAQPDVYDWLNGFF